VRDEKAAGAGRAAGAAGGGAGGGGAESHFGWGNLGRMKFRWLEDETLDNNSCMAIVKGLQGVAVAGGQLSHSRYDLALSFHGNCSYSPEIGETLGFNIYSHRSERCDEILPPS